MPTPRFLTLDDVAEILNVSWSQAYALVRRKELISRLLAGRCEWCEQRTTVAEVHHVRKLADLVKPGRPQPAWAQLMAKRRRKTLVVCRACHDTIHAQRTTATATE